MAIYEIAIAVADRGRNRAQAGDIIVVRSPLGHVGQNEKSNLLWLVINSDLPLEAFGSRIDRKFLDIDRLNDFGLNLDLTQVRNPAREYQPGTDPDPVDGRFRRSPAPIQIDQEIQNR